MEFSETLKQEIMKKLEHKSKIGPSQRTCKSKIEFAAAIMASIAKDPTPNSAGFALEIIKASEVYLKNTVFVILDKLILKILNKVFIPEMIDHIRNLDEPEILAGLCYVKYKHQSLVDERIFDVYDRLNGEMRYKIQKHFGDIIRRYENISTGIGGSIFYESSPDKSYDNGEIQGDDQSLFNRIFLKDRIWNDLSGYKNFQFMKNEMDRFKRILIVIEMIEECKLKDAKSELLILIENADKDQKLIIYNLMSYIHFLSLEFHESIMYINLFLELATGFDWEFGFNCKLFLERQASIPSLCPFVYVDFSDLKSKIGSDENLISKYFENKYLIRDILSESMQRVVLYNKVYCNKRQIRMFFAGFKNVVPGYSILFLFTNKDRLYIYDMLNEAVQISIEWKEIVEEFEEVMQNNREILAMNVVSVEDKKYWWSTRIKLDQCLEKLLKKLKSMIDVEVRDRIMFVLDDSVAYFPFECVFEKPALRILSQDLTFQTSTFDVKSIFYLLDPANNLDSTRKTILEYFESKNFGVLLRGVVGRVLKPEEVRSMDKIELFMYFGHGSGKKYFDFSENKPKALFLFGCSSCRLLKVENFKSNGFCLKHIKKRRIVLGNLWDVTDKDLDKYTMAILEDFFQEKDIIESIFINRNICKLKYLNSAALVLYGVIKKVNINT